MATLTSWMSPSPCRRNRLHTRRYIASLLPVNLLQGNALRVVHRRSETVARDRAARPPSMVRHRHRHHRISVCQAARMYSLPRRLSHTLDLPSVGRTVAGSSVRFRPLDLPGSTHLRPMRSGIRPSREQKTSDHHLDTKYAGRARSRTPEMELLFL